MWCPNFFQQPNLYEYTLKSLIWINTAVRKVMFYKLMLILKAPIPHNGQTHSNNSSAKADELFQCVWAVCKVGA